MEKPGKDTLMLVEDPDDTLKTICALGNIEINKEIFTKEYERVKGRTKPIHKKHADTHFYSLTTFKFLVPSGLRKGIYCQSKIMKQLCVLRNDSNKKSEYETIISNILVNNEKKGKLFEKFLNFIRERKTQKEIHENFKNELNELTIRALIAWSKYAGLIFESGGYLQSIPIKKSKPKFENFFTALKKSYNERNKSEIYGYKRVAILISELRSDLIFELGISKVQFDDYLTELIKKDITIQVYGAPMGVFSEEDSFIYENKKYYYLSMREKNG